MLFSASASDSFSASSASPLDPSLLQANLAALSSSTASSGLIDPLQQSSLSLSSSAVIDEALNSPTLSSGDDTQEIIRDVGSLQAFTTYSFTDYVGNSDTSDSYKFTLDQRQTVYVSVTGLNANAILYSSDLPKGIFIRATDSASDIFFSKRLDPGTYHISVNTSASFLFRNNLGGNTNYTLRIQTTGNNPYSTSLLASQNELGTLRESRILDNIAEPGDVQQYHFNLASTSDLSLSLDNSKLFQQLVQDRNNNKIVDPGELLNDVSGPLTTFLSFSGLPAGSYFALVTPISDNYENYRLNLSATPVLNLGLEPNDSLNQAIELGTLAGQRTFSNSVGPTDKNDYYRFNLSEMSTLDLSLSGLTTTADVQVIRDVNHNGVVDPGEVVASSTSKGTASESMQLQGLDVGAYFIRVNGVEGNTSYTLTLTGTPGRGVAPEPNDTLDSAYNISTLNTLRKFNGFVGWSDANDYYRFTVGTTRQVDLILENLSALADIQLLDSNGAVIATGNSNKIFTSYGSRIDPAQISRALTPGDYILQVQHYEDPDYYPINPDTTYTLRFAA